MLEIYCLLLLNLWDMGVTRLSQESSVILSATARRIARSYGNIHRQAIIRRMSPLDREGSRENDLVPRRPTSSRPSFDRRIRISRLEMISVSLIGAYETAMLMVVDSVGIPVWMALTDAVVIESDDDECFEEYDVTQAVDIGISSRWP
jgi:hypothetical protein